MGTGLRSFEDLDVYKLCCRFRREVRAATKAWPNEEKTRLIDQIIRSSRSTPSQISEGWGRFSKLDNRRFCRIGMGSLCESQDHLNVALEEAYISDELYKALRTLCLECQVKLKGYLKYLGDDGKDL